MLQKVAKFCALAARTFPIPPRSRSAPGDPLLHQLNIYLVCSSYITTFSTIRAGHARGINQRRPNPPIPPRLSVAECMVSIGARVHTRNMPAQ